jgi:beta-phosphoglucomutase-like phosphatase (HAD superfamily)
MTAEPRPRAIRSVLDVLRGRVDHAAFDAAIFALEAVVADLGYGDVRPLIGSIAWIDRLRDEGKSIALVYDGDNAQTALEIAGVADRFDAVIDGPTDASTVERTLAELDVCADRAVLVASTPAGVQAGRVARLHLALAIARGAATPEELRRAGAQAVVADLQELLGPT